VTAKVSNIHDICLRIDTYTYRAISDRNYVTWLSWQIAKWYDGHHTEEDTRNEKPYTIVIVRDIDLPPLFAAPLKLKFVFKQTVVA
jgi:hypothetical protein